MVTEAKAACAEPGKVPSSARQAHEIESSSGPVIYQCTKYKSDKKSNIPNNAEIGEIFCARALLPHIFYPCNTTQATRDTTTITHPLSKIAKSSSNVSTHSARFAAPRLLVVWRTLKRACTRPCSSRLLAGSSCLEKELSCLGNTCKVSGCCKNTRLGTRGTVCHWWPLKSGCNVDILSLRRVVVRFVDHVLSRKYLPAVVDKEGRLKGPQKARTPSACTGRAWQRQLASLRRLHSKKHVHSESPAL